MGRRRPLKFKRFREVAGTQANTSHEAGCVLVRNQGVDSEDDIMLCLKDNVVISSDEIRDMFYRWLEGDPMTLPFSVMQDALAGMLDTMPESLCHPHGFPVGCSVGHAARSSIVLTRSDGREFRLNTLIRFNDERESLEWWRKNRDNPKRVVVEPDGDGLWTITVAGK